jgi:hypothetical protein
LSIEEIIQELIALEAMADQLRQRSYSLRKVLGSFSTPAPSGDDAKNESKKAVQAAVNKRRKTFYNNDSKG